MKIPIIATEQNPKALGKLVKEIELKNAKVFEKTQFSMLIPEVRNELENTKRSLVILFGIEAHACILQTAIDLKEANYDVHIAIDATSSVRPHDRFAAFDRLRQSKVFLTSTQSLILQLMVDSKYEHFKAISAWFKENPPISGLYPHAI